MVQEKEISLVGVVWQHNEIEEKTLDREVMLRAKQPCWYLKLRLNFEDEIPCTGGEL